LGLRLRHLWHLWHRLLLILWLRRIGLAILWLWCVWLLGILRWQLVLLWWQHWLHRELRLRIRVLVTIANSAKLLIRHKAMSWLCSLRVVER